MKDRTEQALEEALVSLSDQIREMSTLKRRLQRTLVSYRRSKRPPKPKHKKGSLTKEGIVLAVLSDQPREELLLRQIEELLQKKGHQMSRKAISAYLTRAKHKNLVEQTASKHWRAVKK